jgi:chemotaxis protein histidine kinase CheA
MTAKYAFIPAALLIAFGSPAAFGEGPDELWETTMSMQSEGMTMPAMNQKTCKKKGSTEENAAPLEKDCKVTDSKRSGSKYTFSFVCDGKDGKYGGSGETEALGKDSYRGKMNMKGVRDGEKFDMSTAFSGKRVGTCTWEDPGKQVKDIQAQSNAMMAKECDKQIESLQPLMIFGGANMPEEALYCKDRKKDFCARATKVAQQMRDPAGFSEANRKYPEWREAMKACGTDPATVSAPVCKVAVDKKDWTFVSDNCPVEGRAIAQQNCAGMDYTAMLASPYKEVCQKYGADLAKKKVADEKAKSEPAAKPAAESKPGVSDTVKEGANKLKKLLKF